MMRFQRRWSREEIALAREMHNNHAPNRDIAEALGRSYKSVKSILYQPRICPHVAVGYLSAHYDGPAIGRCPERERYVRNAVLGSAMLRDAILAVRA